MRTKEINVLSEEERDFQIKLDGIVRAYEKRIHELADVRDSLRKIRRCQYCGGKYYASGLCVNCYNVMRNANGDEEEFKKRRVRYGYRKNEPKKWMKYLYTKMYGEEPGSEIGEDRLKDWSDEFVSMLGDEDKTILELVFKDGWSLRGCANILEKDRGWIMSRINSMKSKAKRLRKNQEEAK